jgi:hypothetical protein
MDKNTKIILVLGVIITIALFFIDIYAAGIAGVLFGTLIMSLLIMQDSKGIPDLTATFRDDAKAVIITNKGNTRAVKIHATLIPMNIEFDVPVLEVESTHELPLPTIIPEVKIILTYENENERGFSRTSLLSAFKEEPDLLKPMLPLFRWKK